MSSEAEKLIEYFDGIAPGYAALYTGHTSTSHFFRTRQEIVRTFLQDLSGGRLLDVGCGPGLWVEFLANKGVEFFGIDLSPKMIAEGNASFGHVKGVHFSVGTVERLEFPDNYFDVVMCLGVLEYVRDIRGALAEVSRVAKPNGMVIISCLNKISPYWLWNRWVYKKTRAVLSKVRHRTKTKEVPIREFREKPFRRLLASQQLEVADVLHFGFDLLPPPLDDRFPGLSVRISQSLEQLLRGTPLRWLAQAYLLQATKHPSTVNTG